MLQFIIRRGLKTLFTLFVVVTAVFFFTRISGNPFEREFATENLTQEMRKELEEYYYYYALFLFQTTTKNKKTV